MILMKLIPFFYKKNIPNVFMLCLPDRKLRLPHVQCYGTDWNAGILSLMTWISITYSGVHFFYSNDQN